MFGNWQQMGMGGVPPPFFAQPNIMYSMYPGSQEAAVAAAASASGPPPHPHQWGPGGQLAPMVFPPMSHPPMVTPTSSAVLKHAPASVGDVDSSAVSSAGTTPAPPLPSNPAPPAPPTEEKPPLPPDPPPPDEDSKQELTAKNPEEEQRMEQLKQQAAQWQQQKKQLDDAQQQYQYQLQQHQLQQQQQQFHQMWMATQYPPPPTDHLMTAPPPLPPTTAPAPVPPLPQHTDLATMPPMGGTIASQAAALPPGTSSLTSTTHSVPMVIEEEPAKSVEEVKSSPDKTNTPVINKSNLNFTNKDPPNHSTSDEKADLTHMENLGKVEKEEEEFNRQYTQWKKQYDDWREQNRDHPDRELFKQYQIQFSDIEAKMDVKRQDIIRRKKMLKGEYVPDSGDTYMMGKCGRMSDSGSGQGLSSQISQFRNQNKFSIRDGPGSGGLLPEENNDCGQGRHGKTGSSVGSEDRVSNLSGIVSGDEIKGSALDSASSQDLNNKKDGNNPLFSKGASGQDVLPGGLFLGGTGCNQFGGPRRRFDGNRSRFDGPSQGPRYQGGPGVLGEGPKQECQGPRTDKEPEFRDSDMRSQGPNQGPPMRGPRFNGPQGGSGFGQSPRGGPPFNQGSFGGSGFGQDIRGFSQNRPGADTAGPRGLGSLANCGVPMQRMGGPLDHVGLSDGQFSRFTGHGGMGMGPGANSQHMSERNHDGQEAKNSDRELPNKIVPKDGTDSANSKTGAGESSDGGGTAADTNNGYQWKLPELQDATSGCHDSTDPSDSSGNNFNNPEQSFNQTDDWRRFGPPPPGSMRGQGVRTRGGLQQPPPPHRNFEEECGPWGMRVSPMGPGFNFNMMRDTERPGPRMMGGPCGMRPMFNSSIGPPGMGPHHRGMMPRGGSGGGGGGMGMQPPFRSDDMGRQFEMNLPANRFDGQGGGPRGDLDLNSMGPKKPEGLNQGEAGLMGSRGDQHSNFGPYPSQHFPRGNCQPNSMEMNKDGKCLPNEEYSRQPFDSRQNSMDPSDTWPSRDRGPWQENQFGYDNNNSRWNPGGNSFPTGQNMDPAYHKGYNRDFPSSDTGQSQWPGDFPGQHSDDNRYNQPRPSLPNAASSMDYDRYRYNNPPPDSRDREYSQGPYDEARPFDRFPGGDYNPCYTETIDYRHKSAKENFDYNQDLPGNKAPTVIDYGHKHPNHVDGQETFKDTDLRIDQDHPRNERASRVHTDRDRSPMDAGERLRDSERDRSHGDLDRLRGRDKDTDMRSRDLRDRNRPMSRDRDRDRDRGRDRDKFRDGRYDQYSRGRERLEEDDKWSERKHEDRKFDRDSRGRYNSPNRGYHNADSSRVGESYSKCRTPLQPETKAEVVSADDLLCKPGRDKRPPQVVVIIRGLPGSGKTYVSKLIRDKETSNGGTAPRMLCMDDYFMVEVEKVEKDSETNKMVKKKVLQYEYEPDLEEVYRQSILKSFKKTIDDGFFPFIIYDCVNEKVRHFEEFWSYAKSKGFQVYVATVHSDVATCVRRNIHGRTNPDITKIQKNWEETPKHHIHLDIRSLLQDAAIPEVEMEDTTEEEIKKEESSPKDKDKDKAEAEEEDEPAAPPGYIKSKWEIDEVGQVRDKVLDKLDGIRLGKRRRSASPTLSLDDYLQLDVYRTRQTDPGKKRVRWADMEERKQQLRRRELGFVVGQTQRDWEKITDDSYADRALNRTKYI